MDFFKTEEVIIRLPPCLELTEAVISPFQIEKQMEREARMSDAIPPAPLMPRPTEITNAVDMWETA